MNLLHPKNIIDVSVLDSWIVEGIFVWLVSVLDVVDIIFSVVSIEVVSFLIRDVVSSDKVCVTFTMVVCVNFTIVVGTFFDFFSSFYY